MDKGNFKTKCDYSYIVGRTGSVRSMTYHCSTLNPNLSAIRDALEINDSTHKVDHNKWYGIGVADLIKLFYNLKEKIGDNTQLDIIIYSFNCYPGLEKVSFIFDEYGAEDYFIGEAIAAKFTIDNIELNFSEMFNQEFIDFFNHFMMINGIMKNSYLEREFCINFSYDDYISFMNMFVGNNIEEFNASDENIDDYLLAFPTSINDHKPDISVVTNYLNL